MPNGGWHKPAAVPVTTRRPIRGVAELRIRTVLHGSQGKPRDSHTRTGDKQCHHQTFNTKASGKPINLYVTWSMMEARPGVKQTPGAPEFHRRLSHDNPAERVKLGTDHRECLHDRGPNQVGPSLACRPTPQANVMTTCRHGEAMTTVAVWMY